MACTLTAFNASQKGSLSSGLARDSCKHSVSGRCDADELDIAEQSIPARRGALCLHLCIGGPYGLPYHRRVRVEHQKVVAEELTVKAGAGDPRRRRDCQYLTILSAQLPPKRERKGGGVRGGRTVLARLHSSDFCSEAGQPAFNVRARATSTVKKFECKLEP